MTARRPVIPNASRSAAFSLVEIVLVMGIVSVLTLIAAPRYARANARYRVDVAAQRLVVDLRYAGTLARVSSTPIKILFQKGNKPDESFYFFETVPDPDRPGELYTVVLREPPYRVVLVDAPGDITYEIDGLPKDSRTFVLSADGEHQRTVLVDKQTGEITVQE